VARHPAEEDGEQEREPYEKGHARYVQLRDLLVALGQHRRGDLPASRDDDRRAAVDRERPERRDDRRDAGPRDEECVAGPERGARAVTIVQMRRRTTTRPSSRTRRIRPANPPQAPPL